MLNISVLLDVQANLPETSPFLSAKIALVSTFFQMLIVLGMYNFGLHAIAMPKPGLFLLGFTMVKLQCANKTHFSGNLSESVLVFSNSKFFTHLMRTRAPRPSPPGPYTVNM